MSNVSPPVASNYRAISATTNNIFVGEGTLVGILISSATAGTFAVTDGATSVIATTAAATLAQPLYVPIGAQLSNALNITVGGVIALTVFWNQ
jgi:hypothetical protein